MNRKPSTIWMFVNAILLAIAVLASTGIFIGLLFAGRLYLDHKRHINLFDREGRTVEAVVSRHRLANNRLVISVKFRDTEIERKWSRNAYLEQRYYSRTYLTSLVSGQIIKVRIHPKIRHVVPASQYTQYRKYNGYFSGLLLPMLLGAVFFIIDPRMLFLGTSSFRFREMLNMEK